MKTLISTGLLAVACLLLSGCNLEVEQTARAGGLDDPSKESSSSNSNTENKPETETETETTTEAEAKPREQTDETSEPGSSSESSVDSKSKAKLNEIERIGWDDLRCPIQENMVVRPQMITERARELDGQRIKIQGVMYPDGQLKGIKEFVLLKNAECKFGVDGQADHLVRVTLNEGVTTKFTKDIYELTGRLKLLPYQGPDGNTWSLFDLDGESVKIKRR